MYLCFVLTFLNIEDNILWLSCQVGLCCCYYLVGDEGEVEGEDEGDTFAINKTIAFFSNRIAIA
jgi:hypothetical protein